MSMSFKASPDGTYGEILVNGQVVAKLPVSGNAVIPGLVGTVSQSGGVPTGAVVERGSNANGEYVRFADGTQICWYLFSGALTSGAWITGLQISTIGTWTYPANFAGNLTLYGFGRDSVSIGFLGTSNTTQSSTTVYFVGRQTNPTSSEIRVAVIGRWF